MTTRRRAGLVVLGAGLVLACCAGGARYRGEGQLSDSGVTAATDRYVLDLGELDLSARRVTTKRLAGLPPHARFVIGISMADASELPEREPSTRSAVVRLTLIRTDGVGIISEQAPLNEWVKQTGRGSASFLYRRGVSADIPMPDGAASPTPVGMRADEGWGSYFTPATGMEYRLTVEVVSPAMPSRPGSRLVARGRGWK